MGHGCGEGVGHVVDPAVGQVEDQEARAVHQIVRCVVGRQNEDLWDPRTVEVVVLSVRRTSVLAVCHHVVHGLRNEVAHQVDHEVHRIAVVVL